MQSPLLHFALLLKASLFSTSGFGNLPSVHGDFIPRHWANERDFAEALTIGQISPGPNGLWVVSFGYLTAGSAGALLAILAILIPPFLVLPIRHLYDRVQTIPAVEGFVQGLALAAVGAFTCVLIQLFQKTGISWLTVSIAFCSFVLSAWRKFPAIAILILAALAGILLK